MNDNDTVKTSELTGQQLDYWVAKAQGWEKHENGYWKVFISKYTVRKIPFRLYTPSTHGGQCFALLTSNDFETESYYIEDDEQSHYAHIVGSKYGCHGSTLNKAICRAFVASVYGEEMSYELNRLRSS